MSVKFIGIDVANISGCIIPYSVWVRVCIYQSVSLVCVVCICGLNNVNICHCNRISYFEVLRLKYNLFSSGIFAIDRFSLLISYLKMECSYKLFKWFPMRNSFLNCHKWRRVWLRIGSLIRDLLLTIHYVQREFIHIYFR